jgi:hypothetical protein
MARVRSNRDRRPLGDKFCAETLKCKVFRSRTLRMAKNDVPGKRDST